VAHPKGGGKRPTVKVDRAQRPAVQGPRRDVARRLRSPPLAAAGRLPICPGPQAGRRGVSGHTLRIPDGMRAKDGVAGRGAVVSRKHPMRPLVGRAKYARFAPARRPGGEA